MNPIFQAIDSEDISTFDALIEKEPYLLEELFPTTIQTAFFTTETKRLTPLGYAALNKNEVMCIHLLNKGADPFHFNMKGMCPLEYISIAPFPKLIEQIAIKSFNHKPRPLNALFNWAKSFIRYDISIDKIESILDIFFDIGFNPEDFRPTELLFSLARHSLSLNKVHYLENLGADIFILSKEGSCLADYALILHEEQTAKALLKKGLTPTINSKGISTLYHAALHGSYKPITDLISKQEDLNLLCPVDETNQTQTALHRAIKRKKLTFTENLILAGANLEIEGINKRTPFLESIACSQFKITQLLLDSGCNALALDVYNNNALHLLIQYSGKTSTSRIDDWTKLLLEKGVNSLEKNKMGKSALDLSKELNCSKAIIHLLSRA